MSTPASIIAAAAPDSNSLADALVKLRAKQDVSPKQLEVFAGAVRSLCKLVGREPEAVPASVETIQKLLDQVPDAVRTRSRKTVANVKSRIKAGLLCLRANTLTAPRGRPLTGEWAQLYDRLPDRRLRNGLSRIMRVACHQGLRPDELSDAFLASVVDGYRQSKWSGDPVRFHRTTAGLWNEAAKIPGWPQVILTLPTSRARPRHLLLNAFPSTFLTDLESYLSWLSGTDVFANPGPPTACKPSTVAQRRAVLRLAASTLAEASGDASGINSLAVLVIPDNVKTILTAYRRRAGERNTAFIRTMAVTLLSVARHWVKVDKNGQQMRDLEFMARKASDLPSGLTQKNQRVLRQLEDHTIQQRLIELPGILAHQARTRRLSPARRAQKFQIALAIELLLVAPLRLQNLSTLRFNEQLLWPTGPDGALFIVLRNEETKNGEPLEYEVPEHARTLLEEYRDRYRVLLKPGGSTWLFVRQTGTPMRPDALRYGITRAIRRELGIHMTPHQFRHFAAQVVLTANPGAYPLVMALLHHRNMKTTVSFYSGRRSRQAGRVYDGILRPPRPTGSN